MSERLRVKMRCSQSHSAYGQHTIELQAVYSDDPGHENARFFEATPSGTVFLSVVRPEVAKHFVVGQEYDVDVTPANAPVPEKHSQAKAKEKVT